MAVVNSSGRSNRPTWHRFTRPLTTVVLHGRRRAFLHLEDVHGRPDMGHLGSRYGGWSVAMDALSRDSVCYLAGVGEDTSFDTALISRFGCQVHAFDPVPQAAEHVARELGDEAAFHFHPVGLWSEDRTLVFYAPEFEGWVSHSGVDFRHTRPALEAPVRSVSSLMSELGHHHLDVLKLSVEGAEFEILDTILRDGVPVDQLLVEFTPPVPLARIRGAVRRLRGAGFQLAAAPIQPWGWKCTFVHARVAAKGSRFTRDADGSPTAAQPEI